MNPSFISRSVTRVASIRCYCWLLCALVAGWVSMARAGTWTQLAHNAPASIGLMMLLPDGTVIAQNSNVSTAWYRLKPDGHGSYVNGTWSTIAAMHDTRLYYSSDVLRDGRVFIAGGEYGTGERTGEVYDPLVNAWLMTPVSGQGFVDSVSKVVANGNVLVAPVFPSSSGFTALYNIVSNTWTLGPKLFRGSYQDEASWVKLPDASILTIDPFGTNSERYIPSSNSWVNDSGVPARLYDSFGSEMGGAFLLPDGRAFYLGSTGHTVYYAPSGTNTPGVWSLGPDIPNGQGTPDAAAAMMVNGKILCAVSPAPSGAGVFQSPTSFYEFDYLANSFTQINAPAGGTTENHPSYYTTMLDLPDGTVLYAHFSSVVYDYQPDGTPLDAGKPVISNITQNADATFHLTGKGLNGISEGACYGDDWQMDSNYPLIRLTDGATNVFYARSMNWSSTGVMTGDAPVSTEFSLPAGIPAGSYSLVVVANGIASDAVPFDVNPITVSMVSSVTEGAGPVTATVTLPFAAVADTEVDLGSSLSNRATVPASVVIAAGETATNFSVTIVDDAVLNGSQATIISATASGYQGGLFYLTVQDNESANLVVTPTTTYTTTGRYGGPFGPSNKVYTLSNSGNVGLGWTAAKTAKWLTLSATSGVLAGGASTNLTATINTNAFVFDPTNDTDTILIDNITNGNGDTSRDVSLTVTGATAMAVSPDALHSLGFVGGPFAPTNVLITVSNTGFSPLIWAVSKSASWLSLSPTAGTNLPGSNTVVNVTLNGVANGLGAGSYADSLVFTNKKNNVGTTTRAAGLNVYSFPTPQLTISPIPPDDTNMLLSWPVSSPAYTLQTTTNLSDPAVWVTNGSLPVSAGGLNLVTNAVLPLQFYRLIGN